MVLAEEPVSPLLDLLHLGVVPGGILACEYVQGHLFPVVFQLLKVGVELLQSLSVCHSVRASYTGHTGPLVAFDFGRYVYPRTYLTHVFFPWKNGPFHLFSKLVERCKTLAALRVECQPFTFHLIFQKYIVFLELCLYCRNSCVSAKFC